MEEYLIDLINRMSTKENDISSSHESVRWKAHREAETLTAPEYSPILKEMIIKYSAKKYTKIRNAIYFALGKVLKKTPATEYLAFIVNQLSVETDKYLLSHMLDRIGDLLLPNEVSIEPILICTKDERWQVRYSAISALKASPTVESRNAIIDFIKLEDERKYKSEIVYANAVLSYIGMMEDIPFIQLHIKSRIHDIKDSATNAINKIEHRGLIA